MMISLGGPPVLLHTSRSLDMSLKEGYKSLWKTPGLSNDSI